MTISKFSFIIILALFQADSIYCQFIAGETSGNGTLNEYQHTLLLSQTMTDSTLAIDLDLDGSNDIELYLWKGFSTTDIANSFGILEVNDNISLCHRPTWLSGTALNLFEEGDILQCAGDDFWQTELQFEHNVSWYVQSNPNENPPESSNQFIFYSMVSPNDSLLGWIQISYDLVDGDGGSTDVWATLHSTYAQNVSTSLIENGAQSEIIVYPNPVLDGALHIKKSSDFNAVTIELVNMTGAEVLVKPFDFHLDVSDLDSGLYLIHLIDNEGRLLTRKLMIE